MSLQSQARAAFAAIRASVPQSVVPVVSAGRTAQGKRDRSNANSSLDEFGERGSTTGKVWVNASELDRPDRGATITVNGVTVMVTNTSPDSEDALMAIEFQQTEPVT